LGKKKGREAEGEGGEGNKGRRGRNLKVFAGYFFRSRSIFFPHKSLEGRKGARKTEDGRREDRGAIEGGGGEEERCG
jgi:hypothetical protein